MDPKTEADVEPDAETSNTKRLRTDAKKLSCKLNEDERNQRARALVDELNAKHETEERHKETKVAMKAEITEHDTRIDKLRAAVATGNETRLVTVDDVADYERGVVETLRRDTGAVVKTRPLNESERQVTAFDDSDGDEEALAAAFEAGQKSKSGDNPYPDGTPKAAEFDRGYRVKGGSDDGEAPAVDGDDDQEDGANDDGDDGSDAPDDGDDAGEEW